MKQTFNLDDEAILRKIFRLFLKLPNITGIQYGSVQFSSKKGNI